MAICSDCNGRTTVGRTKRPCPGCTSGSTKTTHRWDTAVHEAGHVATARALGATNLHARVYDRPRNGANGRFWGRFNGSKQDEAVILLAGAAAAQAATGRPHSGGPDEKQARKLLRKSGTSVKQARAEADRLVRENRTAIDRAARRLHKRGRI